MYIIKCVPNGTEKGYFMSSTFKITDLFLFCGVEPEIRDRIVAGFSPTLKYKKGEYIFTRCDFSRSLGVILSGEAKVSVPSDDGNRVVMKRLFPGEIFGVAALFGGEEYVSDILAVKPCEVQLIPQDQMLKLFEEYPITAINYIKTLSVRIRFLNGRVSSLSRKNALTRVREYFSANAGSDGRVSLQKNMGEVSRVLGIGRSSLYRAVDALEKEGIIVRKGHEIYYKKDD